MNATFADAYARSYDEFYAGKDYERECDYVQEALRRHGGPASGRILDMGCGTGGHAIILAKRGCEVVGVDRSAAMLEIARRKAEGARLRIGWQNADVRTVRAPGTFDAVLFMFAVIGYLVEDTDVRSALRTAREHLRPGGILIFDTWYGPAVLTMRPLDRSRVVEAAPATTIRLSQPTLRADRNVVDVRMRVWHLVGDRVEGRSDETHAVRYFFLPELATHLASAGFEVASFNAFPQLDRGPDESTWNLGCVAVAR
ncbi:MAG: hypothetical protein AUH85_13980 [Chloroflexi bacterium 13_1_40CM_4_68_4]|nr:MAG: hypothetical protein AUH85_13980 [Chloroflexi bacterium 13_1_40CM_4_68_4]